MILSLCFYRVFGAMSAVQRWVFQALTQAKLYTLHFQLFTSHISINSAPQKWKRIKY